MASRWWRAYDEAVDDPKLCLLTDKQHRAWFNLCCITSQNGGKLPAMAAVAFKLRMTVDKTRSMVAELVALGLVDMDETGTAAPHNWGERQFQSDTSTERVKRFRERPRNVSSAVSETPPETEQIQNREEDTADAGTSSVAPYAFESGVIKLKQKAFDQWKQAYSHLDLAAELLALTEWAAGQPKWFYAVSGALAKRNRDVAVRIEQQKTQPAFKWNGIEGVI